MGASDRPRGGVAAVEDPPGETAEPRPIPRASAETEVPVSSMPPTTSIRTVKIRAPTFAEEVLEAGFDPVADLAALPAEEEDEDEVDAGGDQEESDQVEVALLEPGRQVQPGLRLRRLSAVFAAALPRRAG